MTLNNFLNSQDEYNSNETRQAYCQGQLKQDKFIYGPPTTIAGHVKVFLLSLSQLLCFDFALQKVRLPFRGPLFLQTFAVYLTAVRGSDIIPDITDNGRPYAAIVLAAVAVSLSF
jgi:hypothetical protein